MRLSAAMEIGCKKDSNIIERCCLRVEGILRERKEIRLDFFSSYRSRNKDLCVYVEQEIVRRRMRWQIFFRPEAEIGRKKRKRELHVTQKKEGSDS